MNSDNAEAYDLASTALSDEQRLERLEKGRRIDRILLIGLAAVLVIVLASWTTASVMGMSGETDRSAEVRRLQSLEEQQQLLEKKIAALEQQHSQREAAQGSKPLPSAPVVNHPDAIQQVAKTLIGQEQSYQKSLSALKTGMAELAGMIAGSRSWLDYYNEVLDKPMAESRARVEDLQQWSAGPKLTSAAEPTTQRKDP